MEEYQLRETAVLDDHLREFRTLLHRAEQLVESGDLDRASAVAQLAAFHATWRHNGLFASDRLDGILAELSQRALRAPRSTPVRPADAPERVLHVASMVSGLAGLQNLVHRWIVADADRQHSVLVTQPSDAPIPAGIASEVTASGGVVVDAAADRSTILGRAQRILDFSADYDMVILHLETEDVPAVIAMGHPAAPPSALVNHADHCFWTGRSGADLIINLRRSGVDVCRERRAIDESRLVILPTPVPDRSEIVDRKAARNELGVADDAVVLVSVARAPKYEPRGGPGFPALHLRLLERHPTAHLLVVGPDGSEDSSWAEARKVVGDRVQAFGPRPDVRTFFAAADIYVDAHPLTSITSLLEAGVWGLPLIAFSSHGAMPSIWGPDAPGLDPFIVRTTDRGNYEGELSRLITDASARSELGRATRQSIVGLHTGEAWLMELERVYEHLRSVDSDPLVRSEPVERRLDDLDRRVATLLDALDGVEDAHYRLRSHLPERELQPLLWRAWSDQRDQFLKMNARHAIGALLSSLHLHERARAVRRRVAAA